MGFDRSIAFYLLIICVFPNPDTRLPILTMFSFLSLLSRQSNPCSSGYLVRGKHSLNLLRWTLLAQEDLQAMKRPGHPASSHYRCILSTSFIEVRKSGRKVEAGVWSSELHTLMHILLLLFYSAVMWCFIDRSVSMERGLSHHHYGVLRTSSSYLPFCRCRFHRFPSIRQATIYGYNPAHRPAWRTKLKGETQAERMPHGVRKKRKGMKRKGKPIGDGSEIFLLLRLSLG